LRSQLLGHDGERRVGIGCPHDELARERDVVALVDDHAKWFRT